MDKLNIDDENERIRDRSEAADKVTCKTYFNLMNMARSLPELYQSALRFSKASEAAGEAGMEFFTNLKNTSAYVQGSTCDNQLVDFMMTFTKNLCIVQNLHNEMLRSLMLKMSFAESRLEGEYNQTLNDFAEYDKMGAQSHSKLYQGKWDGSTSSINTIDSEQDVLAFRTTSLRKALIHEHVMMFDTAYLIRYVIDRYRRFCIDAEPYLIGIFDLETTVEKNVLMMNRALDDPNAVVLPNYYAGMSELKQIDPAIQKRMARVEPLDFEPGLKTITPGYIEAARRGPAIALQVFQKWEDPVKKDPYGYDDKKIERDIISVIGQDFFAPKRRRRVQHYTGNYSSRPVSDHDIAGINVDKLAQLRERNEALRKLAMEKELGVSELMADAAASSDKLQHLTAEMAEAARQSKLRELESELAHQEALRIAEQEEIELLAKVEEARLAQEKAARLAEENAALLAQKELEAKQMQVVVQPEEESARITEEQLQALQKVESVKFTEPQLITLQQQKSVKLSESQVASIVEQQTVPLTETQSITLEKTKSLMLEPQSSPPLAAQTTSSLAVEKLPSLDEQNASLLASEKSPALEINELVQTDTQEPATQVSTVSVSESEKVSEQAQAPVQAPAKKGFWAKLFKGKNKKAKESRQASINKDAIAETADKAANQNAVEASETLVAQETQSASEGNLATASSAASVSVVASSESKKAGDEERSVTAKRKQSIINKLFKSGDKLQEAEITIQDVTVLCTQTQVRMFRITVNREESKEWFEFMADPDGIPYVTPVLFNEIPLKFANELVY